MTVALKDIAIDNFREAIRLKVAPEQEHFVAPNVRSIAESKFYNTFVPMGIYDGCQRRATASHAAFRSRLSFEQYWPRYLSFMQSRVYDCEQDLVVVAPDGRAAAFCVIWLDSVNKVGLFEPVGTHPDFQRKGMGSALMLESLRRMKANGVETAIVCAEYDNGAAIRLYESVGFQIANRN